MEGGIGDDYCDHDYLVMLVMIMMIKTTIKDSYLFSSVSSSWHFI